MTQVLRIERLAAALALLVCACSTSYTGSPRTAACAVSSNAGTLKNDGTKANLTVTCSDASGKAGTGSATLTAPYGDINTSGTATATLTLDANGSATATYACNLASEPKCISAAVTLTATWSGVTGSTLINVQAADAGTSGGNPDAGGGGNPDGGTTTAGGPTLTLVSVFPAYVIVSSAANAAQNLPPTATATFTVADNTGPISGATVTFAEKQGETLVTLGATSGTTDSSGKATVTITGKNTPGTAHLTASLSTGTPVAFTVPVLGGPSAIVETAVAPDVLGLKGSGIQEHGLMTFTVTDSLGDPIPGVTVNFTEAQAALVTLGHTAVVTDDQGKVAVDYSAGSEVGVGSIIATVAATGASSSHPIAVRGAKPSGSGFYFRCDKANLPVYTTTTQLQQVSCSVRLTDRFGNRVGIPVPVSFATEAGSITASITTKGFDFANPSSADEGTGTVTFTTDLTAGDRPADVAPVPGEPSVTVGSLVINPRDQFVTIIAMTEGEEGFIDANHNGQFDPGENFIDLGDPFVDSNDDGVWESNELHFCGITNPGGVCPTYNGPDGVWDSLTTIWTPTWIVFSGVGVGSATPAGGTAPAPLCADFVDASIAGGHSSQVSAPIYVYDFSLNPPATGSTSTAALPSGAPGTLNSVGFQTQLDEWGAMGVIGFGFDYKLFAAAGGGPCVAGTGACVQKLVFNNFDHGFQGTVTFTNSDKLPAGMTGNGCAPNPNGQPIVPVSVQITATTNSIVAASAAQPFTRASAGSNGLNIVAQSVAPASIYTSDGSAVGLATSATITFAATDPSGAPLANKTITFAEKAGESLVTLSSATAVTSAAGLATVTVNAGLTAGTANIVATLPFGAASGTAPVPIAAASSSGMQVTLQSATPSQIYVQGSPAGLPTSSVITFAATNSAGAPLPNVRITFREQANESLLSFASGSAVTNASGVVSVTVNAGGAPGAANIIASLPNNIATGGAQIQIVTLSTQVNMTAQAPSPSLIYATNTAGLPTTATISVLMSQGTVNTTPLAGVTVTFAEQGGETLLSSVGASAASDASGVAKVTVTAGAAPGVAHVIATGGGSSVTISIPIVGTPTSVTLKTLSPNFLGLQGSGIQEAGSMTFQVTDAAGNAVPGVQLDFAQGVPAILALSAASANTNGTGSAAVTYTAGKIVGVTTITATIHSTTFSTTQSMAVRGAKPSASGFYFRCAKANLGAYDTTPGIDTTTCTVRLSDRYGNRVGIPTAVSFATEAGSITATSSTKAFSYATPSDPDEGSLLVNFSTDMGNGFSPVDVAPLAANAAQVPLARQAEPSVTLNGGTYIRNPRDQLVTIIAMARGEEAFIDNDLNGVYDPGELFVDQGDPFIDANDNGAYDPTEVRFCGQADCQLGGASTAYHTANGVWDSDKVIWAPTWVVFTGAGMSNQILACVDYKNNTNANPSSRAITFTAADPWLNPPVAGTTFSAPTLVGGTAGLAVTVTGFLPAKDQWGAMGALGYDFDYTRVGETCTAGSCVPDPTKTCQVFNSGTNNGCMEALLFYNFSNGGVGSVNVTDSNALPSNAGTSNGTTGYACAPGPTAGTAVEAYAVQVTENGTVSSGSFTVVDAANGTAGF